jgi:hypothetical protein
MLPWLHRLDRDDCVVRRRKFVQLHIILTILSDNTADWWFATLRTLVQQTWRKLWDTEFWLCVLRSIRHLPGRHAPNEDVVDVEKTETIRAESPLAMEADAVV